MEPEAIETALDSSSEENRKRFIQTLNQTCRSGNVSVMDRKMPDGSVVHFLLRPLAANPVSGYKALAVAVLSTILGTLGAMGAFYSKPGALRAYRVVNQIPVVNADVVTGFSICILLVVVFGINKDTFFPLVAGQTVLCAPFVFLSVYPKLGQMDPSIYEAALDLGASPATAVRKVVIPQIMPGIVSGFVMAVTLSLDDYFVATYTKPAAFDTISTYVVNATRGSRTEIKTALWALSTVIFLIVLCICLGMNRNRSAKENTKVRKDRRVSA